MKSTIFFCNSCKVFTMSNFCVKCDMKTSNPLPPRFSPEDKYGKYRRMLMRE